MVRSISAASQAKLDQNLGTEPALIIEIQWVDGGSIYKYADKNLGGTEGKILSVSGLDNTVVVQSVQSGTSSDSQAISVTLDDTDGTIKAIIDSHDIHKEPAWVYQWFDGLEQDEKFLIFKGQISSPMQWNEGDRTVSFDIITRIEDAEVGFSMEEGDFEYVPEELIGQPWPLCFGTVKNAPALRTRSPRKGLLKTGFGIRDYMLAPKKEQVNKVCCPWRFVGFRSEYTGNGAWGTQGLSIFPVYEKDVNCECKKKSVSCEMDLNIEQQSAFEYNTLDIVDGEFFPQGEQITLDILGSKITGSFAGTVESPSSIFNVVHRVHPKAVENNPTIPPITNFGCDPAPNGSENSGDQGSIGKQICVLPDDCAGYSPLPISYIESTEETNAQQAWNYLGTFEEAGFFWAEPGAEVTLSGDNELVYIANLLPSTVHTVKAWRTFANSNLRQLTTVPNTYYTVRQSDFNEYTTTEIVLSRPLSSRGEGWEDDIYVTLTSSVGNNPVDEMEWLIDTYTSFTYDASFADVKAKVANYPMNFMVPGRPNVFDLLRDMAFQGRMALVLRNDEFQLTYLSEEPDEDETITEDDVLANSLVLDHTNTEDLVTKLVCEWRPELHLDDPYSVILRYNGKKYGTNEQTFDFFCYNIQELVTKSATFWMIRMANTWRKIICKTPISKLKLETLDGVYVTLPDIADGEIKCRVETATYDSSSHSIDFVIQTPVRSGERTAFPFHYPANISVEETHPTNEDIQFGNAGGGGIGTEVEAPSGHVLGNASQLSSGFNFGQKSPCETLALDLYNQCRPDNGEQRPTDVDDVMPSLPIDSDNSIIPPSQSPVNELSRVEIDAKTREYTQEGTNADAQDQITANLNTGTGNTDGAGGNGGAGSGGTDDATGDEYKDFADGLPTPLELDAQGKCHYDLVIFMADPVSSVRTRQDCNGNPCADPTGCLCSEDGKVGCFAGGGILTTTETFSFATAAAREAMVSSVDALIAGPATVGLIHPAFYTKANFNVGCEDVEETNGQIGYKGTGSIDGDGNERTLIGLNGFMTDGFTLPSPCIP